MHKRTTGENKFILLPRAESAVRGFDRLPPPNGGDLYFDMEGDPLYDEGLEYLFGVYAHNAKGKKFHDFWGHDRQAEKQAFVALIEFFKQHLAKYPRAHIYHYGHYEPTAMKSLMSLHGVKEAEIDQFLREGRFIDLYAVVREGIRISEPKYSIKNVETFYMEKRKGEVTSAGASIVFYERWRTSRDADLLKKIRDYNEDDCVSTYKLHQWLLQIAPARTVDLAADLERVSSAKSENVAALEARIEHYRTSLLSGFDSEDLDLSFDQRLKVLVWQMLGFHRRADKPAWWAMFSRADMSEEELVDDAECLGGLRLLRTESRGEKRSPMAVYKFPAQETKLREGQDCHRTNDATRFGTIESLNHDQLEIHIGPTKKASVDQLLSIGPGGPLDSKKIREAIFRLAEGLLAGDRYRAIAAFLKRDIPSINGVSSGSPIIDPSKEGLPQIINAVANLQESYLFIQGPPGTGKTYTGSHIILHLIQRGFKVGVASNSHKAIHNLLRAVEDRARESKVSFRGVYKSSQTSGSEFEGEFIDNVSDNAEAFSELSMQGVNLVAGTAWLFSDPDFDQILDFLFIDEAGQVATANVVAMTTSARNLVLLGDQMQLGQPVQGVHPGESGLSSLEYLLEGKATIPPARGIFLDISWRMHPDICDFISGAIYEGRLRPQEMNQHQRIVLAAGAHPDLISTGIRHIPVEHEGNSQSCEPEALKVRELYESLLLQSYVDKNGVTHRMSYDHILVVAPYNVQVNLLKQMLPQDARVGTVDKFQGQEAQVVIVSMTTSDAESMPRNMEFLLSKNRLNVAISRAKCVAYIVASPKLATAKPKALPQMALLNLFSRVVGR